MMRSAARALALAVSAIALVGVTACGQSSDSNTTDPTASTSSAFPVTIKHAMGETTIDEAPMRVVTLDSSYTDAAIGLEANVVGYTQYGTYDSFPEYLGDAPKTYAKDAVLVGTLEAPNLTKIAELEPDLIISAKVRHESIYAQLEKIAPTIFSETTGATWKENVTLLGKALGKEKLAKDKVAAYQARATKVGDAMRAKEGKNPTISIVRFTGGQTVRLYTEKSFPGIVQTDAGLARPANAPTAEGINADISQEQIGSLDADHIFVAVWPDEKGESTTQSDQFKANPLWNTLKGQKHDVSDRVWFSAVSLQGANGILDDLAKTFGIEG